MVIDSTTLYISWTRSMVRRITVCYAIAPCKVHWSRNLTCAVLWWSSLYLRSSFSHAARLPLWPAPIPFCREVVNQKLQGSLQGTPCSLTFLAAFSEQKKNQIHEPIHVHVRVKSAFLVVSLGRVVPDFPGLVWSAIYWLQAKQEQFTRTRVERDLPSKHTAPWVHISTTGSQKYTKNISRD